MFGNPTSKRIFAGDRAEGGAGFASGILEAMKW